MIDKSDLDTVCLFAWKWVCGDCQEHCDAEKEAPDGWNVYERNDDPESATDGTDFKTYEDARNHALEIALGRFIEEY